MQIIHFKYRETSIKYKTRLQVLFQKFKLGECVKIDDQKYELYYILYKKIILILYLFILYIIYDFWRSILVSLVGHKLDSRTFCIWFISRYGIIGIIWGFGLDTGSSIWGFVGQIDLGSSVRLVRIRFKGRRSRTSPLLVWVRG